MKNLLKLVCFTLLSLSLHAQTIINQEYVQQWQAQPASPGLPVYNNCYLYLDQTTHLLIGINSDGTYCLTPGGGGGGGTTLNPGTPYQVTRYDAAGTNIEDSTGSDNPSNGPTEWVSGLSVENNAGYRAFSNSPTGTSTNLLVCLDSTVTTLAEVTTCAVGSTSVLGLADNGAGSTGTVRVAMFGFHSCVFDNQTVIGDWVVPSTSVEGDCSDAGSTKPSGVQVLGHATSLNTGAATLGTVDLFTGDTIAPGGGGNPVTVNPCVQVGCDAYYVMTNVVGGDPNTNDDGNGNKQSKSVGLTDSSQSGFWYEQAGPALPSLDGLNRFYFTTNTAFGTTYGLEPWDNIPTAGHCVDLAAGDAAGWVKLHDSGSPCGAGSGTVTSLTATLPIVATPSPITGVGAFSCPTCLTGVSTGNLSPLFTASFSATTTPVLTFTLSNAAANTVFGNFTNSSGAPSYNAVSACGDSTHALKWTAGTGFGCQLISAGTTIELQTNGVDNTSQVLLNFTNDVGPMGTTTTFSNPSGGVEKLTVTPQTVSTPAAPTLSTNGSAGSTSYSYKIVGCQDGAACAYHTAVSSVATIATGNATLTSSNSINLSAYWVYGVRCVNVYRTASSGTPSSTGLIGNCVEQKFIDTGLAGDSTTAPTTSTTQLFSDPIPLPGTANAQGSVHGVDAPPASPNAMDDEEQWGNGSFLPGDVNNPKWSRVNFSTSTLTLTNGELAFTPVAAGGTNWRLLTQLTPSTPWTFLQVWMPMGNVASNLGMCLYDGTKVYAFIYQPGTTGLFIGKYSSVTAFSSSPASLPSSSSAQGIWYYTKIQDDGTNIKFYYSGDGVNYILLFSETVGTFMTPTQIGPCVDAESASSSSSLSIDYFRRTQ